MSVSEFDCNRLPQQDAPRLATERNACSIRPRAEARVDWRAIFRGHVARIDDVLGVKRDAEQWSALAGAITLPCLGNRLIRVNVLPSLNVRFPLSNAVKARPGHSFASCFPRSHR